MNQLLPYEEELVQKLEHLPVPDLQNAIWKEVQVKLAADASGITNHDDASGKGINIGRFKYFIGFVILIAVIIGFVIFTGKKKVKQSTEPSFEMITPRKQPFPYDDKSVDSINGREKRKIKEVFTMPQSDKQDSITHLSPALLPGDFNPDSSAFDSGIKPLRTVLSIHPVVYQIKKVLG